MNEKFKKASTTLLKFIITVSIVAYIFHTQDTKQILSEIRNSNPLWLLSAMGLFLLSIILGSLQWRVILQTRNIIITKTRAISIYMTGIFFNNFMLGMVAGDAYKVTALHKTGDSGKQAFASTFLDRLAGLLIICGFAVLGGLYILMTNMSKGNTSLLPAISVLLLFACVLSGVFLMLISKRLQNIVRKLIAKLPDFLPREKIAIIIETVFIDRHSEEEKKMLVSVMLYSLTIQTMRVLVHVLCGIALGIFTMERLPYFFVIIPIIALMMIIPLPPITKETVAAILFKQAGFELENALAMELLATVVSIGASLFGGITFVLGNDRKAVKPEKQQAS